MTPINGNSETYSSSAFLISANTSVQIAIRLDNLLSSTGSCVASMFANAIAVSFRARGCPMVSNFIF